MSEPWINELWRVGLLFIAAFLIGLATGYSLLLLTIAAVSYAGWHLWNLYRLAYWLHNKKYQPPDAPGIWGEVFYQFYRLQQRNRKRKRKLATMLKRFQQSTAAMPDGSVVLSQDFRIAWFNKAAEQLLGLQPQQDIGQPVTNLIRHPLFTEYLTRSGSESCKDVALSESKDVVVQRLSPVKIPAPLNPHLLLQIHIIPYGDQQRLLIARDITQLNRLEQIRKDFVANVSHELRNPLTVVAGFLETLIDTAAEDDFAQKWRRPLLHMAQQTARMQNIVNDLLLLSKLESEMPSPPPKPVDVPQLLKNIIEEAKLLNGEQAHDFSIEIDPAVMLEGQSEELRSAFSNLIFNAVRYTPAGGKIIIGWYADTNGAHFVVTDTGEGIAEDHLPRLTERFYRVDVGRSRSHGGTGLGLAIVKHVLNRHQGQLRIQSQLGAGSTFSCHFSQIKAREKNL